MFTGMVISTIGGSMIWPFLMVYVTEKLDMPIGTAALILTINSIVAIIASFIAGPVVDRLGRKWVMVISLITTGVGYLAMIFASEFWHFAVIIGLQGTSQPLYRIAADAMLADLVPTGQRPDAYSIMRLGNNLGVALGPAIGGFVAGASYSYAFLAAFAGLSFYGLLMAFRGHETIPAAVPVPAVSAVRVRFGGYDSLWRDKQYMRVVLAYLFTRFSTTVVWVMLAVYTKSNYGIPESMYGLIPMTNGILVVLFQIPVTQFTKRHDRFWMMSLGAVLYAAAAFMIFVAQGFLGFWLAMVILTAGELIMEPTSSAFIADIAPPAMRGRYMSLYGLTFNVAQGISPALSGALNDRFGPNTMWLYSGGMGFISAVVFLSARRMVRKK